MEFTTEKIIRSIEEFLKHIDICQKENDRLLKLLKKEDLRCQDLLHELELNPLTWKQKFRWIIQMKANRQERRKYKDNLQRLEPIINFSRELQNKKTLESLKKVCEKYKSLEKELSNRSYTKRVKEETR